MCERACFLRGLASWALRRIFFATGTSSGFHGELRGFFGGEGTAGDEEVVKMVERVEVSGGSAARRLRLRTFGVGGITRAVIWGKGRGNTGEKAGETQEKR